MDSVECVSCKGKDIFPNKNYSKCEHCSQCGRFLFRRDWSYSKNIRFFGKIPSDFYSHKMTSDPNICGLCFDYMSDDNSDSQISESPEYIFDHNKRCENCNRFILEEFQQKWDFDRIFSGYCADEIVVDEGFDDVCIKCNEKAILVNTETCKKCERIFLEDYQEDWDLKKMFGENFEDVAVCKGTSDICHLCKKEEDVRAEEEEEVTNNTYLL